MSLVSRFSPHSSTLAAMDFTLHSNISELVFSCRDGVTSLCVVFSSKMSLRALLGNLPDEIEQADGSRFAVDLESIGTDKVRIYVDGQADGEVIRGFYFNSSNRMTILKEYKRTDVKTEVAIDRYDATGALVSTDEPEVASDSSCWTGSQEILDAATDAMQDHNVIFLRKCDKDQSYIRIMK